MNRLEWIGLAVVAGAAGHVAVRVLGRWYRRSRRFLGGCLAGWMDDLDDLGPGRLVHGQPRDDRRRAA